MVSFRNLYAIFYKNEHPNATTAEFSAAFMNLDKSTLLVTEVILSLSRFMCADTRNYLRNMRRRAGN